MPKYLGRATIRVDGQVYETSAGASLDPGGVKRNTQVYGQEVGYSEETAPSVLTCETKLDANTSIDTIRNIAAATVMFECDTGQSYVIKDAFLTQPPAFKDGAGGNVSLNFSGPPAEEMDVGTGAAS
jgi:hypothetical protein